MLTNDYYHKLLQGSTTSEGGRTSAAAPRRSSSTRKILTRCAKWAEQEVGVGGVVPWVHRLYYKVSVQGGWGRSGATLNFIW